MDYAANLALFLLEKTGSVYGKWHGKMAASEQRSLFGQFLGKGTVWIDGAEETIEHSVKVCFGTDADTTFSKKWKDL